MTNPARLLFQNSGRVLDFSFKTQVESSTSLSKLSSSPRAPESKVAAKNGPAAVIKKKEVSAESSDESSDDSEDDDETPAKVTAQKPAAAAKKGPSVAVKKADISSSGSEESSESEDEEVVKKVERMFQAPLMIVQTSEEDSDDSSEEEKATL